MPVLWLVIPLLVSLFGIAAMVLVRSRRVPPTPQEVGALLAAAEFRTCGNVATQRRRRART